ncbi:vitelline membrane outer layer protein 1 homolog [Erpetoichthys calabaricus]|uniref:Vitelline membrane outer layer protein 1 homolog n=1 Tax=Erpetoichthys calabaricus TaxID=27687 RepID=A0A8C4TEQ1_ERPCA|nr:vitelline membrane outer layer protein 1 homolog [Erpetoichthys calabaricus]
MKMVATQSPVLLFTFLLLSVVSCELELTSNVIKAGSMFTNRQYYSTINVTNGGEFGQWTWLEICPEGFYAIGYSLRVEAYQVGGDDTALNGIRLYCSRLNDRSILYTVESHTGLFGDWTQTLWCPSGVLKSFQLRVEPYQGILDDTAANNIKFRCSSSPVLEGFGQTFGDYGKWSDECKEGGICGIETKQEPYQVGLDDTALNDVRFFCCK